MNVWDSFELRGKLLEVQGAPLYSQRHPKPKRAQYLSGAVRVEAVTLSSKTLGDILEPYVYIEKEFTPRGFWLNDAPYEVIPEIP